MKTPSENHPEFPDQEHLGYVNLSEFGNLYLDAIRNNPQATDQDEIPGAMGRFGLDPSNPIPIHGIPNARIYLDNLLLANGDLVQFERQGSVQVPTINLPVDHYAIFDFEDKIIASLYLSPYHKRCSEKAPEGFQTFDSFIE